ncbi:hypothetical protein V5735_23960 (plasmid) [Haladaptatus sp. SPP-AMP-3]|uniref:hypothetical protein n=1 Tax=Haladaptatus sp. SPP-AMP-3 TaxID=3121295 RepID=UPI003C2DB7A6
MVQRSVQYWPGDDREMLEKTIETPAETVDSDIEDVEEVRAQTGTVVDFGFDGKFAIHPDQIPVSNEAYTLDSDEIDWAERVLEGKRKADEEGSGVFTVDGQMIDSPLVERANTILDRAAAAVIR